MGGRRPALLRLARHEPFWGPRDPGLRLASDSDSLGNRESLSFSLKFLSLLTFFFS